MVRSFPRTVDALEDIFLFVERALAALAPGRVDVREIQLVVEELFTNCLRYNVQGKHEVAIELVVHDGCLRLVVTDAGVEAFDITQVATPSADRPLSERRGGGMGLQLVRSICDKLYYEHEQGSSRITAEKRLRSPDV